MAQTRIYFLLDRTGSMRPILDDTIGGFNAYLNGIRSLPEATFSLLLFDSNSVDKVIHDMPVADVPELTRETYKLGATTPLIDAACKTILAVEKVAKDADKVIVVFQTDGHENASTEYRWDDLVAMVKAKTALGWQFVFLGAGFDAYDQAAKMGLSRIGTISYDARDRAATQSVFAQTAANTRSYASGQSASMSFSAEQKAAAGDVWDLQPGVPAPAPAAASVPPRAGPPTPRSAAPVVDDIEL